MQLKKLYINDYKILKDFTIEFPYDFKKYISVLIGTNGSGKSTILEAIAQIFSSILLNEKAKFGFELEYSVSFENITEETFNSSEFRIAYILVKLKANEGEEVNISIDSGMDNTDFTDKIITGKHKVIFSQGSRNVALSYLPGNIVIYYSGLSEIMQELVEPHNEIISTAYRKNNTLAERDFFYFQPEHFGIILTSLLSFEYGDIPDFLRTKSKINGVQSIQIRLQKPEWASDSIQNFWGAKGEVRNFLDYLNENSATADDLANPDNSKGIGNIIIETFQDEAIIITIISQERLFEIRNHLIEERKLFEILNIIFADGMLNDISFSLKKAGEEYQTFGELSEGEQQAIIIKGLTELLSEKNSLFLFDEPDTYLHPKWQRQFITDIEGAVDSSYNSENSFVIATHSPQLLSNAQSELNFVKIIEDGDLIENTPKYYGREINSILYDLMGVEERNKLVSDKISDLYTLIAEEDIEDAESSLKELQDLIGKDDPELKRAEIQITYLKEDE
ncbi:MAG: AAA family ATPase [Bacteroidales bacterium]|nr:AAA family ATPase [Bacteroidales bacterium]